MFLLDQIRQEAGFWNVSIAVVSILVIRLVLSIRRRRKDEEKRKNSAIQSEGFKFSGRRVSESTKLDVPRVIHRKNEKLAAIVEFVIKERRHRVFQVAPNIRIEKETHTHTYPKTDAERDLIIRALNENIVFSNLKNIDIRFFVDYMEPASVPSGTDIVVLGNVAGYFYIVKEGTFSVIQGTKKVATFKRGSSFGEGGLLLNSRRNATVRAEEDAVVWKLDRTTFRKLLLAKTQTNRSSDIIKALESVELLQALSQESISKLAEVAVQVDYVEGQVIVKKAAAGELGYFVMQGVVRVTDLPDGIPDVTYGPGEHFGFQGLVTKKTRNATVVADSDVTVAALSTKDITEILGSLEQLFLRDYQMKRLKSVPLFSEFTHVMLASLLPEMEARTYQEGEHIIRQGEIGTTFFVVEKGECNIVHNDEDGSICVVNTLGELNYFGEMALLSYTPRSTDVIAATKCEVFMLEHATFQRIFGSSLSFSRRLNQVVKGRDKSLRMVLNPSEDITMDRLNVLRVLGQGAFGAVALAQDTTKGRHYAIKAMSIEFIETNKQEVNIVNEKEAMLQCDHPFILKLHATLKDAHMIYFLFDLLPGGELFDRLHNEDGNCVPESEAKFYAACEILALEHLALRSMACRDLKPENIMLDADGYGIMIGMGFAKVIKGKCYTLCGTSEYLAPELCLGTGYNHGVDYFALGVLIYEMICGQTPFHDDHMDDILRNIIRGKVSFGSMFSESAKEVIQKLLVPDPVKRLGMLSGGISDIIHSEWFSAINFDDLVQKKIEAPWKPEQMSFESESDASKVFSTLPIDEDHESTEDWLSNICKHVAENMRFFSFTGLWLWLLRSQRSNAPSRMYFCSFLSVSRTIRVGETPLAARQRL